MAVLKYYPKPLLTKETSVRTSSHQNMDVGPHEHKAGVFDNPETKSIQMKGWSPNQRGLYLISCKKTLYIFQPLIYKTLKTREIFPQ
jgi:hypothetical protein